MTVAQRLALTLVALSGLSPSAACAAASVYVNAATCMRESVFTPSQCQRAYRDARDEFERKAPRFATRTGCERQFQRCMIADIFARGGVDFMPAMRGFILTADRKGRASPLIDAELARGAAAPRPHQGIGDPNMTSARTEPGAYPVPKTMLMDIQERERRYAGERD